MCENGGIGQFGSGKIVVDGRADEVGRPWGGRCLAGEAGPRPTILKCNAMPHVRVHSILHHRTLYISTNSRLNSTRKTSKHAVRSCFFESVILPYFLYHRAPTTIVIFRAMGSIAFRGPWRYSTFNKSKGRKRIEILQREISIKGR